MQANYNQNCNNGHEQITRFGQIKEANCDSTTIPLDPFENFYPQSPKLIIDERIQEPASPKVTPPFITWSGSLSEITSDDLAKDLGHVLHVLQNFR